MRLLTFLFILFLFTAASLNDARKANEAFERGNYAEAVQLYRQAIQQDPDNARLHFNLGNALHRLGQNDEAQESYDRFRSLTDSAEEQSFADYNTGRIKIDEGNFEEALDYFREALKKNPDDPDAKHNYELAIRRQQEQEQEEHNPDSDQDSEGDDEQDNQQQNQQDQEDEQSDGQQPPPQQDQPGDDEQEQEQQPQPLEMSPEEAENILDALEQLERELLENQKKESSDPQRRNEKDW